MCLNESIIKLGTSCIDNHTAINRLVGSWELILTSSMMKRFVSTLLLVVAVFTVRSWASPMPQAAESSGDNQESSGKSHTITGSITQPLNEDFGPEGRPTIGLNYEHKLYEGRDGHVTFTAGGSNAPDRDIEATVGIQGEITFGPHSASDSWLDLFPSTAWDVTANGREKPIP